MSLAQDKSNTSQWKAPIMIEEQSCVCVCSYVSRDSGLFQKHSADAEQHQRVSICVQKHVCLYFCVCQYKSFLT